MIRFLSLLSIFASLAACSSLPKVEHKKYVFPKNAYVGDPKRPYQSLGLVRTRVTFTTLDIDSDENALCANYFNKAVGDLIKRARENGGEAVIDVKTVVFLADGRSETYARAECADDGQEGEVLAQGIAVKWKPAQPESISD